MLAVLAWAWLLRQSAAGVRILVQFFGLAAIVLCLFMLDDSAFLWKRLPFLPFVQFPWRLLGPASLCVALVVAGLGPGIASLGRWCRCAFWTSMALLIIPNLHHLDPGRTIDVDLASWTPLGISARGFETTTMGEVTPRWMTTLPPYNPVPAVVIAGDARLSEEVVTPFSYSAIVTTGGTLSGTSRVRLSRAWFPGWQVYLDGRAADVGPAPETGLIEFAVPAGTHRVEARFGRSPIRQTAEWVSAVALAALLLLAWRGPVGSLNRSRLPRVVID
jgi:hypothetical protein